MKYHTFLFTADEKTDYDWRMRSPEMTEEIYKFSRHIMDAGTDNADLSLPEWEKMIFVYRFHDTGIVARFIYKMEKDGRLVQDSFGRPIFSFEGFTFSGISKRRIVDIPSAVDFLRNEDKLIRDRYYANELADSVEVDTDTDAFHLRAGAEESGLTEFARTIWTSGFEGAYIVGPKADDFVISGNWNRFCDGRENKGDFSTDLAEMSSAKFEPSADRQCAADIRLQFKGCGKTGEYRWGVASPQLRRNILTDSGRNIRQGVSFARLQKEEDAIKKYLRTVGNKLFHDEEALG